jgi:hypothetical protein
MRLGSGEQSLRREVESLLAHESESGDTFVSQLTLKSSALTVAIRTLPRGGGNIKHKGRVHTHSEPTQCTINHVRSDELQRRAK